MPTSAGSFMYLTALLEGARPRWPWRAAPTLNVVPALRSPWWWILVARPCPPLRAPAALSRGRAINMISTPTPTPSEQLLYQFVTATVWQFLHNTMLFPFLNIDCRVYWGQGDCSGDYSEWAAVTGRGGLGLHRLGLHHVKWIRFEVLHRRFVRSVSKSSDEGPGHIVRAKLKWLTYWQIKGVFSPSMS